MWSDIIISALIRLFYNLQSFKFKSGHQSKALVSQLIDDTDIIILGWLLHKIMHAPYTAVVMGYMLWCCTMGTDKIKKKKSPASFHKDCGLCLHWLLTIISVCDVNPCQAGLALQWVTIQKYRTSKRTLKIMKMAFLFNCTTSKQFLVKGSYILPK